MAWHKVLISLELGSLKLYFPARPKAPQDHMDTVTVSTVFNFAQTSSNMFMSVDQRWEGGTSDEARNMSYCNIRNIQKPKNALKGSPANGLLVLIGFVLRLALRVGTSSVMRLSQLAATRKQHQKASSTYPSTHPSTHPSTIRSSNDHQMIIR